MDREYQAEQTLLLQNQAETKKHGLVNFLKKT